MSGLLVRRATVLLREIGRDRELVNERRFGDRRNDLADSGREMLRLMADVKRATELADYEKTRLSGVSTKAKETVESLHKQKQAKLQAG